MADTWGSLSLNITVYKRPEAQTKESTKEQSVEILIKLAALSLCLAEEEERQIGIKCILKNYIEISGHMKIEGA